MKQSQIHITLPSNDREAFQKLARRNGMTIGEALRIFIRRSSQLGYLPVDTGAVIKNTVKNVLADEKR